MSPARDRNAPLARLIAATTGLTRITHDELFGAAALFVGDVPFAVVTADGRIGLRLTDTSLRAALRRRGAIAWATDAGVLDEWVLVATTDLPHPSELASLVAAAHGMACRAQQGEPRESVVRARGRQQTTSNETPSAKRRSTRPAAETMPARTRTPKRTRES